MNAFKNLVGMFTFFNLRKMEDEESRNAVDRLMQHYSSSEENVECLGDLADWITDHNDPDRIDISAMEELSRFFTKAQENGGIITFFAMKGKTYYFCRNVTVTISHLALGYFGVP